MPVCPGHARYQYFFEIASSDPAPLFLPTSSCPLVKVFDRLNPTQIGAGGHCCLIHWLCVVEAPFLMIAARAGAAPEEPGIPL